MKKSVGLKALLVQLISLMISFVVLHVSRQFSDFRPEFFYFLLTHACLAASLFLFLRFDWWWALIQFIFPLCVFGFLQQNIPSYFYLIALAVFSLLFWSTYKTQVPYYPSKTSLLPPLRELLPKDSEFTFVDLGSGMGGLLFDLSSRCEQGHFFGIEYAPLPWLISRLRQIMKRARVDIHYGSFFDCHLSKFDVVFCYLSPAAMTAIWEKAKHEMRPGTLFLSYEFIVPSVKPDIVLNIEAEEALLYGWYL
ncbi:MAG: class I SAM-dependent methyltransferase [Burkholderiales bacterium]|nr:class I SAM-dependent methyltransferase [Burkholderiales bacterium]